MSKSGHDIDLLLWLLCSPADVESGESPHLPSTVSSVGHRGYFKKSRKPAEAGNATNCLRCPIERKCNFSAKKIYVERHLREGKAGWPVDIVEPEIEDIYQTHGKQTAEKILLQRLAEDYDARKASPEYVKSRSWFGRCVWDGDNDVCDDQIVNIVWEDEECKGAQHGPARYAKTATFHQIAHTEAQCARRGRVYGSRGELTYDSQTIRVFDFDTATAQEYHPTQTDFNDPIAKHGGGDTGLAQQFISAVSAVLNNEMKVERAQKYYLGCTSEDVLRSHAMVFAAEEARVARRVVDWQTWWHENVQQPDVLQRKRSSNGTNGWQVVEPTEVHA